MADIKWIEDKARGNTGRIEVLEKQMQKTHADLEQKEKEWRKLGENAQEIQGRMTDYLNQLDGVRIEEKIKGLLVKIVEKAEKKIYLDLIENIIHGVHEKLGKEIDKLDELRAQVNTSMDKMNSDVDEHTVMMAESMGKLLLSIQGIFPDRINDKKLMEITDYVTTHKKKDTAAIRREK